MTGAPLFTARTTIEPAPLDDGVILFNPDSTEFVLLNTSATHVWNQLSTSSTEDELADGLCSRFAIDVTIARDDARDVVRRLVELGLVEVEPPRGNQGAQLDAGNGSEPYEGPTITVLSETELLNAFQMTAAEISAAGCWWHPTSAHP
jgi:hypothetical protein